jgi:hypothetical protein
MSLGRPSWSAVGRAVILGLSVAAQVIEIIHNVRGGL